MSGLQERIKQFRAETEALLKRVEVYQETASEGLIDEKDVLYGLSKALLAGSMLLSPSMTVVGMIVKLGGVLLGGMAERRK